MAVVQSNTGTFTTTSFTATLAGAASGMVVVFVAGNTTINTPAGFTRRQFQANAMGHYLFDTAGAGASSWNFTNAAGVGTWVALEVASGAHDISSIVDTTSGATYTTPTLTPTAGARLLLASIGGTESGGGTSLTVSGWTNSFVEIADVVIASNERPMQGVASLADFTANGSTSYSTTATYAPSSASVRSAIIASYVTTSSSISLAAPKPATIGHRLVAADRAANW